MQSNANEGQGRLARVCLALPWAFAALSAAALVLSATTVHHAAAVAEAQALAAGQIAREPGETLEPAAHLERAARRALAADVAVFAAALLGLALHLRTGQHAEHARAATHAATRNETADDDEREPTPTLSPAQSTPASELQRADARSERADDDRDSNVDPKTARVLIVEDNTANQLIAKAFLDAGGYVSSIANDGSEALRVAEAERFDLILMDINMPVMDGLEATRRLRQSSAYKTTPILAFTAHVLEGDDASVMTVGFNEVLKKPMSRDRLLQRIEHWLQPAGAT